MNNKFFLGIDPGKSGGLALVSDVRHVVAATRMPETCNDLVAWLGYEEVNALNTYVFIEKVASSPQMGVKSAFTFGQNFGRLEGALASINISVELVSPAKWQRALGCLSKGDKNVTKAAAQRLFPKLPDGLKHTHWLCDALLIAEYGRRLEVRG